MEGRLYVVLTAENIHPGKGTPVSQIEMRRISDGVKISERYKTTDQVERAFVEPNPTPSPALSAKLRKPCRFHRIRSSESNASGSRPMRHPSSPGT